MSLPASAFGFEITFPGPKLMPGPTLHGGAGGGPQVSGAVPGVDPGVPPSGGAPPAGGAPPPPAGAGATAAVN